MASLEENIKNEDEEMNALAILLLNALTSEQELNMTSSIQNLTGVSNLPTLNYKAIKAWAVLLDSCPKFHKAILKMEDQILIK